MSVSKLETLPNEILIDIIEKYINGIDIINAFAFQLNRRFDALIIQSRKLRLDFLRCHKNDFRVCMGLLPTYIDKIEELVLSEENAPGQIHAFLSFFPSFDLFKRLRKLYIHINASTAEPEQLKIALESYLETSLHTLCIKMKNGGNRRSLNYMITRIFRLKTLKKLCITFDSYNMNWTTLNGISSNIEYLTIDDIFFSFEDLKHILQCASSLKYLNIHITHSGPHEYSVSMLSSKNIILIPQMSMLHTAVFKIEGDYFSTVVSELKSYLLCMPSLHSLEIMMNNILDDMSVWEYMLETATPILTYFNLEIILFYRPVIDINELLKSLQTPFWIEKKNFNIIIKTSISDARENVFDTWWIGTQRELNDNLSATRKISSLYLSTNVNSLLQENYFDNVKHLVVKEFNDNLFESLTTHVNCSRIRHLGVTFLKQQENNISLFLPFIKNIVSLRISLHQLFDNQFAYLRKCNHLKFLDISANQHSFGKKHISIIREIFPNVEHLIINTQDLRNVPLLQRYLPHLHSLTFVHDEPIVECSLCDLYEVQTIDDILRQKARFLFYRESNKITVWLDQDTLQDSYWINANRSSHDSWFKKLSNRVSSMFN